ncbi:MAG: hypothetical protein WKF73_21295 [Nocardioidaceae bacterium]
MSGDGLSQPLSGVAFHRTLEHRGGAWWRLVASAALGVIGLLAMSLASLIAVLGASRALGYDDFDFDLADGVNATELLGANLGLAFLIPFSAALVSGALRRTAPLVVLAPAGSAVALAGLECRHLGCRVVDLLGAGHGGSVPRPVRARSTLQCWALSRSYW